MNFEDPLSHEFIILTGGFSSAFFTGSLSTFRKEYFPGLGLGILLVCSCLFFPVMEIFVPWIILFFLFLAVPSPENMEKRFEK